MFPLEKTLLNRISLSYISTKIRGNNYFSVIQRTSQTYVSLKAGWLSMIFWRIEKKCQAIYQKTRVPDDAFTRWCGYPRTHVPEDACTRWCVFPMMRVPKNACTRWLQYKIKSSLYTSLHASLTPQCSIRVLGTKLKILIIQSMVIIWTY